MLISVDWLSDFVDIQDLSAQEIYKRFTLGTAEVEEVKVVGEHLRQMSVGQIKSFKKHPEADKLNLVTVDLGKKTMEVVCGANNVREGLKIAYAPVGTTLPIGLTLEPRKIRGVVSEGMLCSEEEIGLAETSEGIMELDPKAPVGQCFLDYMQEKVDTLLDIDNKSLTHRPDLWGHFGMAREFATLFKKQLKNPFSTAWEKTLESEFTNDKSPIVPEFQGESAGLAYYGLSLSNIKVTDSPTWLQRRLKVVGLRPINNIVDISNYIMLELGIPMHIFDRDLIEGNQIIIHRLESDQPFVTLDEEERGLKKGDTVISDAEKPLVIGGIMGGLNSGVREETKNIFIEVANWKAAEIRQTSIRLGLRTDSSQRYEKTLDSQLCKRTMFRALELVKQLCPEAKVVGKLEYAGSDLERISELKIKTSPERICQHLGKQVETDEIQRIFESLGFLVKKEKTFWEVSVPSYRATKDIEFEVDLFEEIGRHVGYDNITPCSPLWGISPAKLTEKQRLQRKIKQFMVFQAQAHELLTRPLVGEGLLKQAMWPVLNHELTLKNAISVEHDRVRPSLVPSFLQAVALNQKNFESFKLFELGRAHFFDDKNFYKERSQLIVAYFDRKNSPFMNLLNGLEKLLNCLCLPFELQDKNPKFPNSVLPYEWKGLHPNQFQNIRIMGKIAGGIVNVHPLICRAFKIKGHLSLAVIDTTDFEERPIKSKMKYRPLPKFPSSVFDCTVVVDKELPVGQILTDLSKLKIKEMLSNKVVDVYQLDERQKSVTLRTVFFDSDKTLSGDFIKQAEKRVVATLEQAGYPLKS